MASNGVHSAESLKYLAPGERRLFTVASAGEHPSVSIECDRLVPGQKTGFEADIESE